VADARLARSGLADLDFLPAKDFGTAGSVKADGVRHENSPSDEMMMDWHRGAGLRDARQRWAKISQRT